MSIVKVAHKRDWRGEKSAEYGFMERKREEYLEMEVVANNIERFQDNFYKNDALDSTTRMSVILARVVSVK